MFWAWTQPESNMLSPKLTWPGPSSPKRKESGPRMCIPTHFDIRVFIKVNEWLSRKLQGKIEFKTGFITQKSAKEIRMNSGRCLLSEANANWYNIGCWPRLLHKLFSSQWMKCQHIILSEKYVLSMFLNLPIVSKKPELHYFSFLCHVLTVVCHSSKV